MRTAIFDIEADGFLEDATKVHSLVYYCPEKDMTVSVYGEGIKEELFLLEGYDKLVGHNILSYDIPLIQKIYPWFKPRGEIFDTLVVSRVLYADIKERDFKLWRRNPNAFPGNLIGRHSLESWGYRFGEHKGDYAKQKQARLAELHPDLTKAELKAKVWETWDEDMQTYCEQDVVVSTKLYNLINKRLEGIPNHDFVGLEHDIRRILDRQELRGFAFDRVAAARLYGVLCDRRAQLDVELATLFPAWEVEEPFTPKRDNKTRGYTAGVTVIKRKQVAFNPNSRDHIAEKLIEKYKWKPSEFTPEGKPKVDEAVLEALNYPEAKLLSEHLMLQKRLGQLAEGKQAWLKMERNGRIHGRVNTNGAVTGRMTHDSPNIAQVPSVRAQYGAECRALFTASPQHVLVGVDADALELRCLAGYMAHYDGGAYITTVLKGNKDEGTDMHTLNAKALGCDRDTAKTWFYAFIYGAGNFKLGLILGHTGKKAIMAGRASREKFLKSLPALNALVLGVQKRTRERGFLVGLDGRPLYVRGEHSALNTLLQSAGAIFMKRAQVILDAQIADNCLEAEFVATVHDEWQIEAKEEHAEKLGQLATDAIRLAGEHYKFKCPLAGNAVIGADWKETH